MIFAGRLNEEFKLLNGTFVRVGEVRSKLIDALAPIVKEVVVCGENEADLRVLAWLNVDAAASIANSGDASFEALNASPKVAEDIRQTLAAYNAANPGASQAVRAIRLLSAPPQLDGGEITDKGSINQRAVRESRSEELDALYSETDDGRTLLP